MKMKPVLFVFLTKADISETRLAVEQIARTNNNNNNNNQSIRSIDVRNVFQKIGHGTIWRFYNLAAILIEHIFMKR